MAIPRVKSTYALDLETVRTLERLARHWQVSKSEALRRAIRAASGDALDDSGDALAALDALQRSLKLSPARARAWGEKVRRERTAASVRGGRRAR